MNLVRIRKENTCMTFTLKLVYFKNIFYTEVVLTRVDAESFVNTTNTTIMYERFLEPTKWRPMR